jgi:carboxyl-terminal processing protease
MRKILVILAALVLWAARINAQNAPTKAALCPPERGRQCLTVTTSLTEEQRRKNLQSFDLAWKIVGENHYDPKLGGVDWQKVRDELRPRIEKADSMDEARIVMQEMLDQLGHSHVHIIPARLYEDTLGATAKAGKASQQAEPGFDVRVVDGEVLVARVDAGSPAAKAGVRPGWRILKIDGEEVEPLLADIQSGASKSRRVSFVQAHVIQSRLRGEVDKAVVVTFFDGSDRESTLSLPRVQPSGNPVRQLGLPPTYVRFEARHLDGDIAYFSLNSFLDPMRVLPALEDNVRKNLKAEGFILDLRGNGGGLIDMGIGMGSWFVDQPEQKLGTAISRTQEAHLEINPREFNYQGPLAVLVDELSASTSEILAGGLQDLKRARVFGTRTAGAVLPSGLLRLPNGDRLQYVVADYVSAGGRRLEGNGVAPDEVVPPDRRALLDGRDPALDAAVRWIRSQRGPNAASR